MAQDARARPRRESSRVTAREAAELARQYIAEMTERQPVQMTSLSPTEDGWLVEVEVIEDQRIPSSSDILALYEVELDADGELLAYRRIRRYLRGQTGDGGSGA
jgi:gas vesicle protein GvpO